MYRKYNNNTITTVNKKKPKKWLLMNNIINLDLVGTETLLLELREKKNKSQLFSYITVLRTTIDRLLNGYGDVRNNLKSLTKIKRMRHESMSHSVAS